MSGPTKATSGGGEDAKGPVGGPSAWGRVSRMVNACFSFMSRLAKLGRRADDYEQALLSLSRQEAVVNRRIKRRAAQWRWLARSIVLYGIVIQMVALVYAMAMTRMSSTDTQWKHRALHILPLFLTPLFATALYSGCGRYHRMRARQDAQAKKDIEELKKQKLDELKEKTKYYKTLEVIQKYETDPGVKAAVASALVRGIGAEAGIKATVDESDVLNTTAQSAPSTGSPAAGSRAGNGPGVQGASPGSLYGGREMRRRHGGDAGGGYASTPETGGRARRAGQQPEGWASRAGQQPDGQSAVVDEVDEDERQGEESYDGERGGGGVVWWAVERLAAMLVGEDPTQCYALVCRRCHRHNGLVKKEDLDVVLYHCKHCGFLNKPKQDPVEPTARETSESEQTSSHNYEQEEDQGQALDPST